jgi:hypothetical protein
MSTSFSPFGLVAEAEIAYRRERIVASYPPQVARPRRPHPVGKRQSGRAERRAPAHPPPGHGRLTHPLTVARRRGLIASE